MERAEWSGRPNEWRHNDEGLASGKEGKEKRRREAGIGGRGGDAFFGGSCFPLSFFGGWLFPALDRRPWPPAGEGLALQARSLRRVSLRQYRRSLLRKK